MQGIYILPFGTAVGVNEYVASGVPITREAAVYPASQFPVQYLGRGSDGRTDVYSQTDVYVQHEFKAFGDRRIQVSLNVLNLFDQKAASSVYVLQTAAGQGLNIDEPAFFAGNLNFQTLLTSQGVVIDPRFLQANSFQSPITARVGVKFIF
jgi:outer membrane receptor protein involved in Fe transport